MLCLQSSIFWTQFYSSVLILLGFFHQSRPWNFPLIQSKPTQHYFISKFVVDTLHSSQWKSDNFFIMEVSSQRHMTSHKRLHRQKSIPFSSKYFSNEFSLKRPHITPFCLQRYYIFYQASIRPSNISFRPYFSRSNNWSVLKKKVDVNLTSVTFC